MSGSEGEEEEDEDEDEDLDGFVTDGDGTPSVAGCVGWSWLEFRLSLESFRDAPDWALERAGGRNRGTWSRRSCMVEACGTAWHQSWLAASAHSGARHFLLVLAPVHATSMFASLQSPLDLLCTLKYKTRRQPVQQGAHSLIHPRSWLCAVDGDTSRLPCLKCIQ